MTSTTCCHSLRFSAVLHLCANVGVEQTTRVCTTGPHVVVTPDQHHGGPVAFWGVCTGCN